MSSICRRSAYTFNSLSRDHLDNVDDDVEAAIRYFQLPLSGSRGRQHLGRASLLALFQLPLSGSQNLPARATAMAIIIFQLPLSGSRDHSTRTFPYSLIRRAVLSTPSLGITPTWRNCPIVQIYKTFNSLSRDHGITQQGERDMIVTVNFQLPLSGSLRRDD